MLFHTSNPYDNRTLAEYKGLTDDELTNKLKLAETTFEEWRKSSFSYRSNLFKKLAELLQTQEEKHAKLMTLEMGKPIQEARAEIQKCALVCEYYAEHAEEFLKLEEVASGAQTSFVSYEPIGCVLGIMPWNFPYWQAFRYAVPTLMAGNVTCLKHAPNVFGCAEAIEQLFLEAGFPQGVLINLIIDIPQVEEVIATPIVQAVTLTGSELAGSKVAALAGKYIKKSVLELGGSDPFIVLQDANLELAAKTAIQSRMRNAGQSCIAAKRFIVESAVLPAFQELLITEIQKLTFGNPLESQTTLGPMARIDLAEKLFNQVKQSIAQGATVLLEGKQEQAHFHPVVLSHVKPGMPAFDEELFGPVASIIEASDEQEAIQLANHTSFGLGASLWTEDKSKARELVHQINAGAVFVNAMVKSDPRLPFGGIKRSGYGRELSHFGIREFVNVKTISID